VATKSLISRNRSWHLGHQAFICGYLLDLVPWRTCGAQESKSRCQVVAMLARCNVVHASVAVGADFDFNRLATP
jgi:hypothetical protein